jgi:hypothetical protein
MYTTFYFIAAWWMCSNKIIGMGTMHLLDGASCLLESFVSMAQSNVKPILMINFELQICA